VDIYLHSATTPSLRDAQLKKTFTTTINKRSTDSRKFRYHDHVLTNSARKPNK